jgi:hypothetical protein
LPTVLGAVSMLGVAPMLGAVSMLGAARFPKNDGWVFFAVLGLSLKWTVSKPQALVNSWLVKKLAPDSND